METEFAFAQCIIHLPFSWPRAHCSPSVFFSHASTRRSAGGVTRRAWAASGYWAAWCPARHQRYSLAWTRAAAKGILEPGGGGFRLTFPLQDWSTGPESPVTFSYFPLLVRFSAYITTIRITFDTRRCEDFQINISNSTWQEFDLLTNYNCSLLHEPSIVCRLHDADCFTEMWIAPTFAQVAVYLHVAKHTAK